MPLSSIRGDTACEHVPPCVVAMRCRAGTVSYDCHRPRSKAPQRATLTLCFISAQPRERQLFSWASSWRAKGCGCSAHLVHLRRHNGGDPLLEQLLVFARVVERALVRARHPVHAAVQAAALALKTCQPDLLSAHLASVLLLLLLDRAWRLLRAATGAYRHANWHVHRSLRLGLCDHLQAQTQQRCRVSLLALRYSRYQPAARQSGTGSVVLVTSSRHAATAGRTGEHERSDGGVRTHRRCGRWCWLWCCRSLDGLASQILEALGAQPLRLRLRSTAKGTALSTHPGVHNNDSSPLTQQQQSFHHRGHNNRVHTSNGATVPSTRSTTPISPHSETQLSQKPRP